jgi:ketosteroid isomerase-like protein
MKPEQLQSIAFRWFEAFNNKELEKLLSLYDEDAKYFSPNLKANQSDEPYLLRGKAVMRTWWKEAFEKSPSLFYKVKSLTANGDRVFMEYSSQVDNEEDIDVAEVLEVKSGKIISSRVYHG